MDWQWIYLVIFIVCSVSAGLLINNITHGLRENRRELQEEHLWLISLAGCTHQINASYCYIDDGKLILIDGKDDMIAGYSEWVSFLQVGKED